jgi:HAD superfamily hydrolase (TIGR01509 family)
MKFDAVIFDCDGVLVDSEAITSGVLRDMLDELGWRMSPQECHDVFLGKALQDELTMIHSRTGILPGDEWIEQFRQRRNSALAIDLQPIPGVHDALAQISARWRSNIACASGADRGKILLQLEKVRLIDYFADRTFSGYEMARNKPFPDVYQAAMAALGVDARRCAVVEDSVTGITAGAAAGATVYAYAPQGDADPLYRAGASHVFTDMAQLPALLG